MAHQKDPTRIRQAATSLKPGSVLRFFSPRARKVKLHVLIASMADRSIAFYINTRPAPFIIRDAELAKRQIEVTKNIHPFLTYDSFVACHDVCPLGPMRELAEGIVSNEVEIIGQLHASLYDAVLLASRDSPLIADRDQTVISRAFNLQR